MNLLSNDHPVPILYFLRKSRPKINGLLMSWHTIKLCLKGRFSILSSQSTNPIGVMLCPEAVVTFNPHRSIRFGGSSIDSKHLVLMHDLVAPVSISALHFIPLISTCIIAPLSRFKVISLSLAVLIPFLLSSREEKYFSGLYLSCSHCSSGSFSGGRSSVGGSVSEEVSKLANSLGVKLS